MPIVDVLIPTFNRATFLQQALHSLQQQTESDFRAIIGDNCSTDNTQQIIDGICREDPRFTSIRQPRNLGGLENANILIKHSTAPYIHILHDDDWLEPDFLKRSIQTLEQFPTAIFIFSQARVVYENGSAMQKGQPPGISSMCLLPHDALFRLLLNGNFIISPSVVARTTLFDEFGGYEKPFLCTDWQMWLRVTTKYDAVFLAECHYNYRVHGKNESADLLALGKAMIEMFNNAPSFTELTRFRSSLFKAGSRATRTCLGQLAEKGDSGALRDLMNTYRASSLRYDAQMRLAEKGASLISRLPASWRGSLFIWLQKVRRLWRKKASSPPHPPLSTKKP